MENSLCVQPNVELPSDVLSAAVIKCGNVLVFISNNMHERLEKLIAKLNEAIVDAETLRRKILISKTTGTVTASVGTTLNVIGVILIPFTVGLSVPILCGIGTTFTVTGALTSLGTTIADVQIQSTQRENIKKLIDDCVESTAQYKALCEDLEHSLQKCDSSESLHFDEFLRDKCQRDIEKWLKAGYLHKDVIVVNLHDLKKGDHIFRIIKSSPIHKHHGIYINDQTVVELCREGVKSRSLKDFRRRQKITRREYLGGNLPAEETVKLAKEAINPSSKHRYNLLNNNCEHFATAMKLSILWSSQVDEAFSITSQVFKNVHRPISLIMEGVESSAQITTALAPKTIFSFFRGFSTPVMSNLAKASLVLGQVSVALDITSLVFDYKRENVSADVCRSAINQLEKIKTAMQTYEKNVKAQMADLDERRRQAELLEEEIKRLELKRIEEEKIEKQRIEEEKIERRWRDNTEIKIVGFCILYFFYFLTELFWSKEIS